MRFRESFYELRLRCFVSVALGGFPRATGRAAQVSLGGLTHLPAHPLPLPQNRCVLLCHLSPSHFSSAEALNDEVHVATNTTVSWASLP